MKHLIYIIIVLLITGCNKDIEMNEFHKMYGSDTNDVGALIQEVAKHKIYFGHQSVGNNILSGINQWEEETGVKLEKTNTRDFSDMVSASFVHYYVGENGDAYSKRATRGGRYEYGSPAIRPAKARRESWTQ